MSEQPQTEEKRGGVLFPLATGAAAGYLTHRGYQASANKLALDAISDVIPEGGKAVSPELRKAAVELAGNGTPLKNQFVGAANLKTANDITKATITKAVGEGAKGYDILFERASGNHITIKNVEKLTGEASNLLAEGQTTATVVGEQLKTLTAGGEKSWVAGLAAKAEQGVAKGLRAEEVYKAAGGGKWGAIKHAGGLRGTGIVIGATVATVGVLTGIKRMFSSSHASREEARMGNPATQASR